MNLELLRSKGIQLPEIETEDGLTAKDIMDKIRSFYHRLEKRDDDYAEAEFLELLYNYPQSMCKRHMTETIKLLIAVIHLESKPNPKDEKPLWQGYSYEDLALMFDLSKASIHEAIRQKKTAATQLLGQPNLRVEARALALEELKKEEKLKILQDSPKGFAKTSE